MSNIIIISKTNHTHTHTHRVIKVACIKIVKKKIRLNVKQNDNWSKKSELVKNK